MMWLNIGLSWKITKVRSPVLFYIPQNGDFISTIIRVMIKSARYASSTCSGCCLLEMLSYSYRKSLLKKLRREICRLIPYLLCSIFIAYLDDRSEA